MIKVVNYTKVNANGNTQEKTFQWNSEIPLKQVVKSIFGTEPIYNSPLLLVAIVGDNQTIIIDKTQSAIRY